MATARPEGLLRVTFILRSVSSGFIQPNFTNVLWSRVTGILRVQLNFGEAERGWDFRTPGRGEIDFESIIRALNRCGYEGPLSVEWEDSGMDREHGAGEACAVVRSLDFEPSLRGFHFGD